MADHEVHDDGSAEERGFALHVLAGMAIGLPIFVGMIIGLLKVATEQETDSIVAVAVWAGLWAALFLGGGAGAGLWLLRNEH